MERPATRVLLIEDNMAEAEFIGATLGLVRKQEYVLEHASYLKEGIALLHAQPFDVVIVDLGLPDSQGLASAVAVRRESQEIPVVILTVLDDEETALKALEMDIQDYLIKGEITSSTLSRTIGYAIHRKKIALELEVANASRREMAHMLDLSPALACDLEHRITHWSRGMEELSGWSREEAIGAVAHELLRTVSQSPLEQIEETVFESGFYTGELVHHKKDGTPVPVVTLWVLYRDQQGVPLAILRTMNDITQRKAMEEELRLAKEELESRVVQRTAHLHATIGKLREEVAARRKAEHALHEESRQRLETAWELQEREQLLIHQSRMAAMGEMIGFIAHQWRQPLNVLGAVIQEVELAFQAGDLTEDYLESRVAETMAVVQQMSVTINDFRDFFKPEGEKVAFGVAEEVTKTMKIIDAYFRDIALKVEFVAADAVMAHGFPTQFGQVILNILLNARDAFLERKVAHPLVAIRIWTEGEKAVIAVADNAGGIAPEIVERVFDPYFTTKGPEKGTGIGLYIAKLIIERNMNGTLSVRNSNGGAEFTIEIPASAARP
ncbi:response regulator [Geomonas sp. RF6]|uniref:ATP-binding protein n=1 Tax=Geomonas sp. RF6 TaxID=2897342 RepID=UPI001E5537A2|nr:ATP-binding protein [Geomonas sp. RF6]UFS69444.1 response regulator [Geomonas sp. RF6]